MRKVSTRCARRLATLPLVAGVLALTLALVACAGGSTSGGASTGGAPVIATDALGHAIRIPAAAPQRIVSLTPADSEMLAAVGATTRVVAVDFYTDYPKEMATKQKITDGQSFNLNVEAIIGLKPDLVLGYNAFFKADEDKLLGAKVPVIDLPNVTTIQDSLNELLLVGQLTHADATARSAVDGLRARVSAVEKAVAGAPPVSVYMESGTFNGQYSTFGAGSYGDDLIRAAGGSNIFGANGAQGGYPNVSAESIIKANPAAIVTTQGAAFGGDVKAVENRPGWLAIAAVKNGRIYVMDANEFSRPVATRLVQALEDLARALHPDRVK